MSAEFPAYAAYRDGVPTPPEPTRFVTPSWYFTSLGAAVAAFVSCLTGVVVLLSRSASHGHFGHPVGQYAPYGLGFVAAMVMLAIQGVRFRRLNGKVARDRIDRGSPLTRLPIALAAGLTYGLAPAFARHGTWWLVLGMAGLGGLSYALLERRAFGNARILAPGEMRPSYPWQTAVIWVLIALIVLSLVVGYIAFTVWIDTQLNQLNQLTGLSSDTGR